MDNTYRASGNADAQYSATPPSKPHAAAAIHQRTYQACIPCRKRKVRCDLGSVDNPSDPPCGRCRRESKECYFSATRRKKKGAEDGQSDDDEASFEIKDGRKRLRTSTGYEHEREREQIDDDDGGPRTPGGSIGQLQPLRRPAAPRQYTYNEEDQKASEQTVGLLQTTEIHGGHDALKLLAEAARKGSRETGPRPNMNGISPASLPAAASPINDRGSSYTNGPMAMLQNDPIWKTSIHPTSDAMDNIDQVAYNRALKAWERFRFVRAGWFRAKEAVDYIDYFFVHLAPLTPVDLLYFRPYAKHEELLTNEPMLTITMLLIASRHMKLEGPGSVSRPYSIHQKLWTYLSGMINRVLWGQEQFGGGFCGAGSGAGGEPGCDVNPLTRKGLRTLGTIESLVLLTEWHPRAMHFPPDEADDELMVPDDSPPVAEISESGMDASKGIGGQRMDTWLEPCWRSDRMCWMLLGLSMSLAFEIGVFDASEWQRHARSSDGQPLSAEDIQRYDRRRGNVRNLLLVYVTQTSGRLGLTSMLPANYSKPEDSMLFKQPLGQQESVHEADLHFWLRMASLMREGNQKLYANKTFTRDLIKNGDYKAVLQQFQEPLHRWREDFDNSAIIPKYMRCILEIEYEYCRVYVNALALQAVAERCANVQPFPSSRPTNGTAANARGDAAISPHRLAKLLGGDRHYMHEVGEAARNLLKVVVYGLYPGEYLRHAPVRTYFRIISAAIVLLKSFSLGATETDVSDSLQLMDKTVEALRGCIVDDVHVASRFADLLDTLTQNLKPRLVRIAADGRSKSRRVSHPGSPGLEPVTAPLNMANPRLQAQQRLSSGGNLSDQQQQQHWSYNNNLPITNDPLHGISNATYDLLDQNNNFSIMPPPTFTWQSPAASQTQSINTPPAGGLQDPYSFGPDGLTEDWFAMDLNPIINSDINSVVDVSSTMYGPQIGDTDMLELLLGGNQQSMM